MSNEPVFEAQFASVAAAIAKKSLVERLRGVWRCHGVTISTQVLTAGLGVLTGVLAPRLLGPDGRGELAAITLWPLTLTFLATLGMDRAAAYFAAKGRPAGSFGIGPVATTCLVAGLVQSFAVLAAGFLFIPMALHSYGPHVVRLALLFLASAPFLLLGNLLASLLLGHQDMRGYNLYRLIAPATYSLTVLALFVVNIPSLTAIVVCQAAGFILAAMLIVRIVRTRLRPAWRWEASMAVQLLKYGAKTQIGGISNFLNQRLDQLLMSLFLPSRQLGIYVAAVAFSDALCIIPRGIGLVTLADSANAERHGAWQVVRRSLLLTALWLLPCAVILWMALPRLLPVLFGEQFTSAVVPCRILIPGSCAMGMSTVLFEAARGMNHPEIPAYAETAGLVMTAVLLALLLKPYGVMGAAVASTVAYTLTLGITWPLLSRRSREVRR